MSTNQAFINWIKLTPETAPEADKDYLVVESSEGDASYCIAKYYNKGAIVSVEMTKEKIEEKKTNEDLTTEERLLLTLFKSHDVEIPEDGFYIITKDYGTDEENYPGCAEIPVSCGFTKDCDTWYAELPVEPEGLRHPYVAKREMQLQIARVKKEAEEKHAIEEEKRQKALDLAISEGGLVDQVAHIDKADKELKNQYDYMRNNLPKGTDITDRYGNVHKGCFTLEACIFKADKDEWNLIYASAAQAVRIYQAFTDKYTNQDILNAHMKARIGDTDDYKELSLNLMHIIEDMDKIGISNKKHGKYRKLLIWTFLDAPFMSTPFNYNNFRGPDCWYKRLKQDSWFKNLPVAEQIVIANSMYETSFKLRRCAHMDVLMQNTTSLIITANELRVFFENLYYLLGTIEGYTKNFEKRFKYTPEGTFVGFKNFDDDDIEEPDEDEPPFPDDLPEYDEFGVIPYMYNKETGKWEDQRDPDKIQEMKDESKKIEAVADAVIDKIKSLAGIKYDSLNGFIKDMRKDFEHNLYFRIVKTINDKTVIRISADTGVYDITFMPVFVNPNGFAEYNSDDEDNPFSFETVYFTADESDVYTEMLPATKGTSTKYFLVPN